MNSPLELGATGDQDVDEQTLLAGLRAGDDWAYEQLVRTFGGRLLAVARRILRNEEDAQDAVQSAYLSAFRAVAHFEAGCLVSTWLHRIVVNAALMRIRARQRKPEMSIEPLLPRFAEDGHHAEAVTSWADSAEQLIERQETQAMVRAAIAELPESYRVIVMMRDIDGMSTEEAAAAFGITENALKLRLHRARLALGTILKRRMASRQPVAASAGARRRARSSERASLPAA